VVRKEGKVELGGLCSLINFVFSFFAAIWLLSNEFGWFRLQNRGQDSEGTVSVEQCPQWRYCSPRVIYDCNLVIEAEVAVSGIIINGIFPRERYGCRQRT